MLPRSGHHALVRCLLDLLPDELSYCDFYRHCRQVPCTDPATNYHKTHDFDLRLPIRDDLKYIVQIRNPLEAIPSWYKYKFNHPYTRSGERGWKKVLDCWLLGDNRLHWEFFFRQKTDYWKGFARKWSEKVCRPNVLLMTYRDFVENSGASLEQVLAFAEAETEISANRIRDVVDEHRVEKRRELSRVRYFDTGRFRRLERDFMPIMEQLGIEPILIMPNRRQRGERSK